MFSLLAACAFADNSCRQCSGQILMIFASYLSEAQATQFLKTSLGSCATGNDYVLLKPGSNDCMGNRCKDWFFSIVAWRYCGNGPKVVIKKDNHGIGDVLAYQDYMTLVCTKSVRCHGDCNCAQCGC